MKRCACCGYYFGPSDTQHLSDLKGSKNITLCEECHEKEEGAIEQYGTKDLSNLLNTYTLGSRGRAQP